jgi:hypothetical protein
MYAAVPQGFMKKMGAWRSLVFNSSLSKNRGLAFAHNDWAGYSVFERLRWGMGGHPPRSAFKTALKTWPHRFEKQIALPKSQPAASSRSRCSAFHALGHHLQPEFIAP